MKTKYRNLLSLSLLLLSVCFYSSCTDYDVKTDISFYDDVSIKISGTENDTLFINLSNKQQIELEVDPADFVFDMRSFTYHVEDSTVLKIDAAGNIEPIDLGTTEVGLTFRANNRVTARTKVCIWRDLVLVERIMANDINLKIGNTYDLKSGITIVPANADNKELIFESLTPDILSVDDEGLITTIQEGTGQVKISSTDGSGVSAICNVAVLAAVKVTEIRLPAALDGNTITIGQSIDLNDIAVVLPDNADIKDLSYTILSGADVVTIDENGILKATNVGTARIRIGSTDGSDISKEFTQHVEDNPLINRGLWTVTTQTATDYGYIIDGSTGAPEHLFDGNANTFLSLVKPGKQYGIPPKQPADFIPSFTIDMKAQQTFNYFIWRHRGNNNNNFLRVYGIKIEASNDGTEFTTINNNEVIWIPNTGGYVGSVTNKADRETYTIAIPESTYRYVRIKLEMWSDAYKGQHPDYPGNGAASGGTMQIGEFGLGKQ